MFVSFEKIRKKKNADERLQLSYTAVITKGIALSFNNAGETVST